MSEKKDQQAIWQNSPIWYQGKRGQLLIGGKGTYLLLGERMLIGCQGSKDKLIMFYGNKN